MTLPILRGTNLPAHRPENVRDTALTAFNPWRELDEMTRWFDEFMDRSFGVRPAGPYNRGTLAAGTPVIDLYESPEELRLFAYVPGAKSDDFDISVTGTTLTLRGERQPLIEGEQWTAYSSGIARTKGTFEASYNLPFEVDASEVSATYHEGILEIHLPKAEQAKVKKVTVNVESK